MADRDIRIRFVANVQQYRAALTQASAHTRGFGREITGQGKATSEQIERVGRSALVMGGLMAAGFALSAKAAIDWESAFAGVEKTVDGTASQMSALEAGLRQMATELPASHAEIAAVAEAAGQLGIKVGDVEAFTRVMIDLGETTNLSAEEAATSLARFANIMGTSSSDFDRLGSTIVELGNNSETTEAEITEMGQRLAAAGAIAGLSEADVLAFASTLTSVGVNAEAGGTALSKVFTTVRDATIDGGEALETFAQVAGVTAEDFARSFREDPAAAIDSFIQGLGRMNASGQSTTAVFEDLELTDQRLMRALLSTAEAGDHLADRLDMAGGAWEDNIALQIEAEKRYQTTGARFEILRNQVTDLGIEIGAELLPMLAGAAEGLSSMATGAGELPDPLKAVGIGLAGLATTGLTVIGVIGTFGPSIQRAKDALMNMGTAGQFVGRNMGRMAAGVGVAGVALAGLTWYLGEQARKQADAEERARSYTDAMREQGGAVGEATDELALQNVVTGDLGQKLVDAEADLSLFASSLRKVPEGLEEFSSKFVRLLATGMNEVKALELALKDAGLAGTDLGDELVRLADEGGLSGDQILELTERLGLQAKAAREGARELDNDTAATEAVGGAADEAAPAVDEFSGALSDQEQAAQDAEDALSTLNDTIDALIGINVSAEQANIRVLDTLADLKDSFEENGATIDEYTEKGRTNRGAVLDVVDAISNQISIMAEQGASTDEISGKLGWHVLALRNVMTQAGMTDDEVRTYIEGLGLTPDNISTLIQLLGVAESEQTLADLVRDRFVRIHTAIQSGGPRHGQTYSSTGGYIAGAGQSPLYRAGGGPSGTDTIPAWLTPGEYVMQKSAVDAYGVDFMQALNNGNLQMYSGQMSQRAPAPSLSIDYERLASAITGALGPDVTQVIIDKRVVAEAIRSHERSLR